MTSSRVEELGQCFSHSGDHRYSPDYCLRWAPLREEVEAAATIRPPVVAQAGLLADVGDGKYRTPLASLELAKCRTCGRDIIWLISPAGARLPVDASPTDPHVYAVVLDPDVGPRAVKVQSVIDADWRSEHGLEADHVYISHWRTCPNPPRAGGAATEAKGRPYVEGGNRAVRKAKGRGHAR